MVPYRLLVLQLCRALGRFEVVSSSHDEVEIRLHRPPLRDLPELLCLLGLVLPDEHLGSSGVRNLRQLFLLPRILGVDFVLGFLLGNNKALLVILKYVVEASQLRLVLADVVAAHHTETLSLILFEFHHGHGSRLVVIDQDLEVDQVVCLDDAVLELYQHLLLVLLELRELDQVSGLNARALQNRTFLDVFWQVPKMELVITRLCQELVEPVLNGNREIKLQLLFEGAVRDLGELLLEPVVLEDPPCSLLYQLRVEDALLWLNEHILCAIEDENGRTLLH